MKRESQTKLNVKENQKENDYKNLLPLQHVCYRTETRAGQAGQAQRPGQVEQGQDERPAEVGKCPGLPYINIGQYKKFKAGRLSENYRVWRRLQILRIWWQSEVIR